MDEDHRERTRDTERTTIVHTGGGGGGGGGTAVAVILGVLLIGLILLAVFGGIVGDATEDIGVPSDMDVDVNIDTGDMQLPEVDVPQADPPADDKSGNSN